MSVEDAAWGIYEIITEQMASAARVHIAEKGGDPRNYALIATGGAAPLHACHMAKKLHIRRIVCPPDVGVASAAGLLAARPRADAVRVLVSDVDAVDWARVEALVSGYGRADEGFPGGQDRRGCDVGSFSPQPTCATGGRRIR